MFYVKTVLMFAWAFLATLIWFPLFWVPGAFARWIRTIAWGVLKVAGVRVELEGAEHMDAVRPCVFVGNHQSAFDMATFGSIMPYNCTGIGKKEIALIPFIGWNFFLHGGFFVDRKNRERATATLKAVAVKLREKKLAVGIMPEGTRNPNGKHLLPFKKGAFHLAIAAQADLVIVLSPPLDDVAHYERRVLRPAVLRFKAFPPISVRGMTEKDVDSLKDLVRERMVAGLAALSSQP